MGTFHEHRAVQEAARIVLAEIAETIRPADTERSIVARVVSELAHLGITETWYHDCPALMLLGSRSCLSTAGRHYEPADEPVGERNLVTIDFSPSRKEIWGDCARNFYVEDGVCRTVPLSPDVRDGAEALTSLTLMDRTYLEPGNPVRLRDVPLLTFEPHLRRPGGPWGFKHEEIYRLDDTERLVLL